MRCNHVVRSLFEALLIVNYYLKRLLLQHWYTHNRDDRHREPRWRWSSPAGGNRWHLTKRRHNTKLFGLMLLKTHSPNDRGNPSERTYAELSGNRITNLCYATVYNATFGANDWISIEFSYQFIPFFILHFKFTGKYVFGVSAEGNYKCSYE